MYEMDNLRPINTWFKKLEQGPVIISGPCSAESEEQMIKTAQGLKNTGKVQIFRAGIWKPRTRPDSFEGMGGEALQWLDSVKRETGMLTTVEVASPRHVEQCLKHNVDIMWIGARTTSNPFSVQELASALQGMNIPVMVKNPINPDVNLWIGALERIYKAGITRLAAIHRGFYPFEETWLRNIPKWELAIELKSRFHNLPIICDPSHIAGTRKYIREIAQKSLDLNVDGLMIESHFDPSSALSDAEQQLTPEGVGELLDGLVYRCCLEENGPSDQLEKFRDQIDSVDTQLLELLAQRMRIVQEIGEYKSKNNITILQLRRWEKVREKGKEIGQSLGLSANFVTQLLRLVHKEAIHKQTQIMNQKETDKND